MKIQTPALDQLLKLDARSLASGSCQLQELACAELQRVKVAYESLFLSFMEIERAMCRGCDRLEAAFGITPPQTEESITALNAADDSMEVLIGTVRFFPKGGAGPGVGWVPTNGQALLIEQWPQLLQNKAFSEALAKLGYPPHLTLPNIGPDLKGDRAYMYLGESRKAPMFEIGEVCRYATGSSAFFLIDRISWHVIHGGWSYHGPHILSQAPAVSAFEGDLRPMLPVERNKLLLLDGIYPPIREHVRNSIPKVQ